MPNRPSALKALRQNKKRRLRNRSVKSRLRTERNKFNRFIAHGDIGAAEAQLKLLVKLYHKAAAKKVIHANRAARQQAQVQKMLNEAKARSA